MNHILKNFYSKQKSIHTKSIKRRLFALFRQPIFILFTIWGNGFVLIGATVFYLLEKDTNPVIQSFIDSLAWSVGTVTTIGYGGIIPLTTAGKVVNILMMAGGSLFLWSYMALFVSALVSPELNSVESEIKGIESDISELKTEMKTDTKVTLQLKKLTEQLRLTIEQLEQAPSPQIKTKKE